jgi:hypothetical protein
MIQIAGELCKRQCLNELLQSRNTIMETETQYFMILVRRIVASQSWASLVLSVPIIDSPVGFSSPVIDSQGLNRASKYEFLNVKGRYWTVTTST